MQNAATLTDDEIAAIKTIALNEPLLAHRLISPTAHVTGVNVTINLPGKRLDEVPEVPVLSAPWRTISARVTPMLIYISPGRP
ncbi:MAG: hypothetical protein ACE5GF_10125 [Thermodesulfobacteriota bacterium]